MKRLILGTAGHIDHGKSTLVKALTGIDPDRLKEEKERGITIELGYAYLYLEPDIVIGIVDVPGHERFIKTMVSGATGVDMVLLVVAADEGIMAQTKEHFEICKLLGLKEGLIAITKVSLVDEELIEVVEEEIKDMVKGSFLEGKPIVRVDGVTGYGLEELREKIKEVANNIAPKSEDRPFRLYIDRVFTLKGFGTVVTGTAISGSVSLNEEVDIHPLGRSVKVRGLQVYGKKVDVAYSGMRVALNLAGVEKSELDRGYCIAKKGVFSPTTTIISEIFVSNLLDHPIKNGNVYRFLAGCSICQARIHIFDGKEIEPGGRGLARINLDRPLLLVHGDRFIIRGSGTLQTYGGGVVLDPHPPKLKFSLLKDFSLCISRGDIKEKVLTVINYSGAKGITLSELTSRFALGSSELSKILNDAKDSIVSIGNKVYSLSSVDSVKRKFINVLENFHKENPIRFGMTREELRSRLEVDDDLFDYLLDALSRDKEIKVSDDIIALSSFQPSIPKEMEEIHRSIQKILKKSGLTPPTLKDLQKELGDGVRECLAFLEKAGKIIKVTKDIFVDKEAFQGFVEIAKGLGKEGFTVQDIKSRTGLTRKYLIPYLEMLDKMGLTFRAGDKRFLRR